MHAQNPTDDIQPWKKLSSKIVLNEAWFTVRKDAVQLPSGTMLDDYFIWDSPDCATTVPITPDGKFVLCQQYRYAVDMILYQFPAGTVDKGETPAQAAARELEEETGYVSPNITPLGNVAPYASRMTGWQYLFLAEDAQPTGTVHYDDTEDIKIVLKTPKELWAMLDTNKIMIPDSFAAGVLALRRLGL